MKFKIKRFILRLLSGFSLFAMALSFQNCSESFRVVSGEEKLSSVAPARLVLANSVANLSSSSDLNLNFEVVLTQGLEITSVNCQIDASQPVDCTDGNFSISGLADGDHVAKVTVEDDAGRKVEALSSMFRVDATAPTLTVSQAPSGATGNNFANLIFTASDATSGIDQVLCSLDGGAFANCASPVALTNLSSGLHVFRIKVSDKAGSVTNSEFSWEVDQTAPTLSFIGHPLPFTMSTSATFTFDGRDNGKAVTQIGCSADGSNFLPCQSPVTLDGLTVGAHKFEIRAEDAAGNVSQVVGVSWVIDTKAPTLPVVTSPQSRFTQSTSLQAGFTSTDDASGISGFECSINSSVFRLCASPYELFADVGLTLILRVRAIDGAGNVSAVAGKTWTVDRTPPDPWLRTTAQDLHDRRTAYLFQTPVDNASGIALMECQLNSGAFVACSNHVRYENLPPGKHTYTVRVTDGAGNVATRELTWTVGANAF